MPKKVDFTPEEDEYDLFTVVNPYPLNADMELAADRLQFAQWMAAVTGNPDVVMTLYHKPSAPRTVIVALTKTYGRHKHRRVLGRHQWSGPNGFLKERPASVTDANYSGIFYCRYRLHAEASKIGWKCFTFLDWMFGTQQLRDKVFQTPYPVTTSMQVPPGDAIAFDLCAPLPVAMFGPNATQPRAPTTPGRSNALKTLAPTKDSSVQEVTNEVKKEEPVHLDESESLWGGEPESRVALLTVPSADVISDLPQSSFDFDGENYNYDDVCLYHGITCKKMCAWRSEREKKKGPKKEGPSNTKNYNPPSTKKSKRSSDRAKRTGNSTPVPTIGTPTTQPTSPILSPKRTASPGSARGHGVASTAVSSGATTPTQPTPSSSVPSEPVSPGASSSSSWHTVVSGRIINALATTEAGRGAPTGPVRGAPAWSSRGRGKGRGAY